MALKDLTEYFVADLDLPYRGKVYSCPPPSQHNGLVLAAIVAAGTNIYAGQAPDAATQALLDSLDDTSDISRISLGETAYDQMVADNVPGPHIAQLGSYAMYYWVLGEPTADAMFASLYGQGDDAAPKAQPTGRATASGSPTRTASTRATKSRPATSDHKPRSKADPSRGKTSSSTGA